MSLWPKEGLKKSVSNFVLKVLVVGGQEIPWSTFQSRKVKQEQCCIVEEYRSQRRKLFDDDVAMMKRRCLLFVSISSIYVISMLFFFTKNINFSCHIYLVIITKDPIYIAIYKEFIVNISKYLTNCLNFISVTCTIHK